MHTVDTFLQFFRAYYDDKGYLIYNLSTIRRNYLKSGWFFLNLLSSIPTSLLIWSQSIMPDGLGGSASATTSDTYNNSNWDHALMILDVFKLLRLFRLKRLMSTSSVVDSYWERMNVMFSGEFVVWFILMFGFGVKECRLFSQTPQFAFYIYLVIMKFLVMITLLSVRRFNCCIQPRLFHITHSHEHMYSTRHTIQTHSIG